MHVTSMQVQSQACRDFLGFVAMPMFTELLYGGSSLRKIWLKIVTRLVPLWFASSRSEEVVESLAVARETERRLHMPVQTRHFPTRKKRSKDTEHEQNTSSNDAEQEASGGRVDAITTQRRTRYSNGTDSIFTRTIGHERAQRATRPPVRVPLWLTVPYVVFVWGCCTFMLVRINQLDAPCEAAGTIWTSCRVRAYPVVDFSFPGPDADRCACNTFAAAPGAGENKTYVADGGTEKGSDGDANVYADDDCISPRFMEKVHTDLFGAGAQAAATAAYTQTVILYSGCVLNNTHVNDMFDKLKNLRVVMLLDSPAIVPPLQLPASAMTSESQLVALRLVGMGLGEIPPEIGRLAESLSLLYIIGNRRVRRVPPELGQCTNLGIVNFRDNAITSLPSELGRLTGLAALNVNGNKLSSLPAELGSLTNMHTLNIGRNRLTALPSSFGRMAYLEVLGGAANRLTSVPILDTQPQAWPKLSVIDLEGNCISTWPKDWTLQRIEEVAQLSFNTTTGDDGDGFYDTYVDRRRTETRIGRNSSILQGGQNTDGTLAGRDVVLVGMSGNPVVSDGGNGSMTAAGAGQSSEERLWEFSRGGDTVENVVLLVISRGNCAFGCNTFALKATGSQDFRGDYVCDISCNVSACNFDDGDCTRAVDG